VRASSVTYGPGHFNPLNEEYPEETQPNYKLVIVWGGAWSDRMAARRERIKRLVKNGAKLVVIDPRRIGVTKMADLWIKPQANE